MATAVKVPLEEYLKTSYHPDLEYLDGELREKSVVTLTHGEVQILLGVWFYEHRKEWQIRSAVEVRTQVSANQVRLPDFVVLVRTNRELGALTQPPLVAIEVLSPSDSYRELKGRAADLAAMGVRNVWLIDPELRTAELWRDGAWQRETSNRLQAVDSPVYLDLAWLWERMDE